MALGGCSWSQISRHCRPALQRRRRPWRRRWPSGRRRSRGLQHGKTRLESCSRLAEVGGLIAMGTAPVSCARRRRRSFANRRQPWRSRQLGCGRAERVRSFAEMVRQPVPALHRASSTIRQRHAQRSRHRRMSMHKSSRLPWTWQRSLTRKRFHRGDAFLPWPWRDSASAFSYAPFPPVPLPRRLWPAGLSPFPPSPWRPSPPLGLGVSLGLDEDYPEPSSGLLQPWQLP